MDETEQQPPKERFWLMLESEAVRRGTEGLISSDLQVPCYCPELEGKLSVHLQPEDAQGHRFQQSAIHAFASSGRKC